MKIILVMYGNSSCKEPAENTIQWGGITIVNQTVKYEFSVMNETSLYMHERYTVESFIFVGLKFRGFQVSDKLVGI